KQKNHQLITVHIQPLPESMERNVQRNRKGIVLRKVFCPTSRPKKNKKRLFGLKKSTVLPYNLPCKIFRIVLTVSSRNRTSIPASRVKRILSSRIQLNQPTGTLLFWRIS